ncbi:helix-turn-helix domain-containing protein [Microbaculum marinisediminis]|uniref:Helix-turn-helix domain-containing protein n=1 Tax=Microbaculum marinisediminis TaxID=2931392 RepID=A0AAW5QXP9_9HYPH|nr:helix-turn-helix domain-containing protein [Microbaculum sp. A6E488]MCT8971188.1 helix-turn-helix domain-containing protein [Microbaculum sp. A6E488]
MSKRAFDKIKAGLENAIAISEGKVDPECYRVHVPEEIDVKAIRKQLRLTQQAFSDRYGFSLARLRDWEQGRSRPDSAARAYLKVISQEHEAVERALRAA